MTFPSYILISGWYNYLMSNYSLRRVRKEREREREWKIMKKKFPRLQNAYDPVGIPIFQTISTDERYKIVVPHDFVALRYAILILHGKWLDLQLLRRRKNNQISPLKVHQFINLTLEKYWKMYASKNKRNTYQIELKWLATHGDCCSNKWLRKTTTTRGEP